MVGELKAEEMHVLVFEGINEQWLSDGCINVMREWMYQWHEEMGELMAKGVSELVAMEWVY